MSTVRVFELAKELGIPVGDVMTRLRKMGIPVKSHSSAVDRLVVAELSGTPMRVHEVAKELGISAKELTPRLEELGVDVKSHMSTVEPAILRRLADHGTASIDASEGVTARESVPEVPAPPVSTEPASKESVEAAPLTPTVPSQLPRSPSIEELADRAERLARLMPRPPEPGPEPSEPSVEATRTRTATRVPRTIQERIEAAPGGRILLSIFAVVVVAAVLISNLPASYSGDLAKRRAGRALVNAQLYQGWNMFAPDPPTFNVRLVAVVRYTDGTRTTWSPPVYDRITGGYRDFRWRRSDSITPQDTTYYNGIADWLARKQRADDGRSASEVIFYQATAPSPPPGNKQKPAWQLVKILTIHPVLDT